MSDLTLIPIKNQLFSDYRLNEVKALILKRLTELNMIDQKYKLDTEFLTLLVNMVEHFVVKKDKIDKKALVVRIMREFFGATDEDVELISRNVEYLHANKVIRKLSFWKVFKAGVCEWFFKKR